MLTTDMPESMNFREACLRLSSLLKHQLWASSGSIFQTCERLLSIAVINTNSTLVFYTQNTLIIAILGVNNDTGPLRV